MMTLYIVIMPVVFLLGSLGLWDDTPKPRPPRLCGSRRKARQHFERLNLWKLRTPVFL
jgi:hypothetical protein